MSSRLPDSSKPKSSQSDVTVNTDDIRIEASTKQGGDSPSLKNTVDDAIDDNMTLAQKVMRWALVAVLFYLLIFSIEMIGDGFKLAAADNAKQLFDFARNPIVGLMIGILATTMVQSSSTTTSIVVSLVASGMPVSIAVPIIMGANIGTTITNTLASLGSAGEKEPFRRAFAAATVHDFFNLMAVAIFLPLEMATGFLERIAGGMANAFSGASGADTDSTDFLDTIIGVPAGFLVDNVFKPLAPNEMAAGIIVAVVGVVGILLVVRFIGIVLGQLMVGNAKNLLHNSIGRGPVAGMGSGMLVTVMAQSSSVTTSLMVPLAAAGTIKTRAIYPYTLGANVGTTMTALLASMAVTDNKEQALQIAFVHLMFNVSAILVIYVLPFLRQFPLRGAETLARLATENKMYVVGWVLGVYVALPLVAIFISNLFYN